MKVDDVAVVGAGPAGLAAAIQLRRHGLQPLLFEEDRIGGMLWRAVRIENYPGFPEGIAGPDLARLLEDHAASSHIETIAESVLGVDFRDGIFEVRTGETVYRVRAIVVASGTKPRKLTGISVDAEALRGIIYDVEPLLEITGKRIAIIGAGDAAFDYALNLSRRNEIVLINRSERTRCLPLLEARARERNSVTCFSGTAIESIGAKGEGALVLEGRGPRGAVSIKADYVLGAVGREPRIDSLSPSLLRRLKELMADELLHLAGDVVRGPYRQAAIAAGDGVLAGMRIADRLAEGSPCR